MKHLILILAIALFAGYRGTGGTPGGPGPQIAIEDTSYDFGSVKIGDTIEHVFVIRNTGTDTLTVTAHPSCGCTAAILDEPNIAPHSQTRLDVKINTHGKGAGAITKSITMESNSADSLSRKILMHGRFLPPDKIHKADMMHVDGIFAGNCASCHADKGEGLYGRALFAADCAICHGLKEMNKEAPDIRTIVQTNHTPEEWHGIVANGIAGKNMPAFDARNGGPLDDSAIASVVDYVQRFRIPNTAVAVTKKK